MLKSDNCVTFGPKWEQKEVTILIFNLYYLLKRGGKRESLQSVTNYVQNISVLFHFCIILNTNWCLTEVSFKKNYLGKSTESFFKANFSTTFLTSLELCLLHICRHTHTHAHTHTHTHTRTPIDIRTNPEQTKTDLSHMFLSYSLLICF